MIAIVDYQQAYEADEVMAKAIPSLEQIEAWANAVLVAENTGEQEITVRFTDDEESQTLNHEYRGKDKPTNVLSFPFEVPPGIEMNLLGDLVICVPVIMREAEEQDKTPTNHYAHMVVHGILHLLGYDHIDDADADIMEAKEIRILASLNIGNPYQ
ncbi:probable rRNA maturation factor [Alteromonas sp. 76-1]|uniref:rRNA maturation RNase YbeY n=1 Tax=unclassified Alteromonas TaxID=2614992 RepID=UPI000FD1858A|nr:rRNA maturation RNase YbeY [Alteromonas sp. 76-1]MBO7923337.1 rRNA maturation RNase YbeY [Alteromonas sp. K632G]VEL96450.1 probable rRNA maturation factor [Alteromonas sp. 76-1]